MSSPKGVTGEQCSHCDAIVFEKLKKGLCQTCVDDLLGMQKIPRQVSLQPQRQARLEDSDTSFSDSWDVSSPRASSSLVLSKGDPSRHKPKVMVDPKLTSQLKDHQKEGVKFIWKNCFSDYDDCHESNLGGCILAHFMGLGKSFTTISLLHTVMTQPCMRGKAVSSVLMIVPCNTLSNWGNEVTKWTGDLGSRIRWYNLGKCSPGYREAEIKTWKREGGIMFMNEQLFLRKDQYDMILKEAQPEVLVLDEAHTMLKHSNTKISKTLRQIKTKRKILLTGTPLQNDVTEFYQLVNYVRPGAIRGVKSEGDFETKYRRRIERGLPGDALQSDKAVSKEQQLALKKFAEPFVHRKDASVVRSFLPEYCDTLFYLRPSRKQQQLMRAYTRYSNGYMGDKNFFRMYQNIAPLLNHPGCLKLSLGTESAGNKRKRSKGSSPLEWLTDELSNDKIDKLDEMWLSPKFIIMAHILAMALLQEEKCLIYSKCLKTLDLVEKFLQSEWKRGVSSLAESFPVSRFGGWKKNVDFLRIDGTIDSGRRGAIVDQFNTDNKARVLAISSLAGGIGINLTAATRVIILDNHFNPSVSAQCAARARRFGQEKPVYCYRLAIQGTLEAKVYARSANKTSVASCVVDGEYKPLSFTTQQLADLNAVEMWFTCSKCKKERLVKEKSLLEGDFDEDTFVCNMNASDLKRNTCSAPEQKKNPKCASDASIMDPIAQHILNVVNKRTRHDKLVTGWASVQSPDDVVENRTGKSEWNTSVPTAEF